MPDRLRIGRRRKPDELEAELERLRRENASLYAKIAEATKSLQDMRDEHGKPLTWRQRLTGKR